MAFTSKPAEPADLTDLYRLAELMAGVFNNQAQAQADPTWYVPLMVWQRPVALFSDSITLFLEQANPTINQSPYRQRVLRLSLTPAEGIRGQYYALKEPTQYQGGGQSPERLQSLDADALMALPSCWVSVSPGHGVGDTREQKFEARPQDRCTFTYRAQTICIELGFDIYQTADITHLLSYEKGVDPQTGRATWGALMGPFDFVKQQAL